MPQKTPWEYLVTDQPIPGRTAIMTFEGGPSGTRYGYLPEAPGRRPRVISGWNMRQGEDPSLSLQSRPQDQGTGNQNVPRRTKGPERLKEGGVASEKDRDNWTLEIINNMDVMSKNALGESLQGMTLDQQTKTINRLIEDNIKSVAGDDKEAIEYLRQVKGMSPWILVNPNMAQDIVDKMKEEGE